MNDFWTYYRLLRKHLRLIAVTLCVGLIAGVGTAIPRQREFSATVTLTTAPPDESRYVLILVTDQGQPRPDVTKALAMELIKSRTVAERVVQRLNLDRSPHALRARLRVLRGEGDLIHLTITDKDSATAVLLANTYAEVAVAYNQEINRREAGMAREFIERELEGTTVRLRQAENALDQFKRQNGMVALSTQINAEIGRFLGLVAEQRGAALAEREVTARIAALRARLQQFTPTKTDQQFIENPVAQRLRAELANLEVSLAIARATQTDQHPNVIALNRRIEALKESLEREIKRVVATEFVQVNPIYESVVRSLIDLETTRIALQAKQTALRSVIPAERQKLPALNDIEREFARLSREVQILETAYASLQGRLNDFRIREQAAMNRNLVYIVDLAAGARPAQTPPTLPRIVLLAMLGLSAGVGWVLFRHQIDDTVKSAKEAEDLLGGPVLTSIPKHNPPFDEAYRLLKTNLGLHTRNGGPKAIMFTSGRPGSGTSTIIFNLAQAIARGGKRVVVVDADLRQPTAHRLFEAAGQYGLEDVLLGLAPAGEALCPSQKMENVQVLPAGTSHGELADLFASESMAHLLQDLKGRADVILIDAPPVMPFAEARALAPMTDGVVFVVAAGQASRGIEQEAKRQLERVQARLLGIVVNKVPPEDDEGYVLFNKYDKYERPAPARKPGQTTTGIVLLVLLMGSGGVLFSRHSDSLTAWVEHGSRLVRSMMNRVI